MLVTAEVPSDKEPLLRDVLDPDKMSTSPPRLVSDWPPERLINPPSFCSDVPPDRETMPASDFE